MGLCRFSESLGLKPINQDRFNRCLKSIRYALLTGKKYICNKKSLEKRILFECQIFRMEVLTEDTVFTSPIGDRTAILRGHPIHAKV